MPRKSVLSSIISIPIASLYEVFEPNEARRISSKLEFHYTPKPGSWLNLVEFELSILVNQCLKQRIPDLYTIQNEVTAWQNIRHAHTATLHWRFGLTDAHVKVQPLHPMLSP
jgi:hypothetical protein